MFTKVLCQKCNSQELMYQEVYRRIPFLLRLAPFIAGAFLIIGSLLWLSSDDLFLYITGPLGVLLLYVAIFKIKTTTLTAIRLKCKTCEHLWIVEDPQLKHARKWTELPPSEWRKATPASLPRFMG